MFRLFIIFCITLGTFSSSASALQLVGATSLQPGQFRINAGVNYLAGLVSPPATFTHVGGVSKARIFEEYLEGSYGLGDFGLEESELVVRGTFFQAAEEKIGAALIHDADQGGYVTLKYAGNWIHSGRFVLGSWLQTDIPFGLERSKFVKPNINFIGVGLNSAVQVNAPFNITQSLFVGSGLFSNNDKNPNIISTTIGNLNVGQMFWGSDLVLGSGFSVEADLTERTDSAYAASGLGRGDIRNLVFITPFVLRLPLGQSVALSLNYAFKWVGQSVRGDQFGGLDLGWKF